LDLFLRTVDNVRPATTHLLTPLSEGNAPPAEAQFDSPLQVFRPAAEPNPQSSPVRPSVFEVPPQETRPAEPVLPPSPPSTLRTRFHDLIARRRAAARGAGPGYGAPGGAPCPSADPPPPASARPPVAEPPRSGSRSRSRPGPRPAPPPPGSTGCGRWSATA
jgi:hypothetical protein